MPTVLSPTGRPIDCRDEAEAERVRAWVRWMVIEASRRERRMTTRLEETCGALVYQSEGRVPIACQQPLHGGLCRYHGRRSGA